MTDEALLEQAAKRDETAFAVLYQRHRDALFTWAWRLTGSATVAEDLVHDCFVALLKRPERFHPDRGSQLRTYLFAMLRNLSLKRSGRSQRELATEDIDDVPDSGTSPLEALARAETASLVDAAVAALPQLQREVLVLAQFEEISASEIAAVVGADIGTVKARLHRARERLRRMLAPMRNKERSTP
jgi:RNA polymerase sigma-70 factor (ECF subfamily)